MLVDTSNIIVCVVFLNNITWKSTFPVEIYYSFFLVFQCMTILCPIFNDLSVEPSSSLQPMPGWSAGVEALGVPGSPFSSGEDALERWDFCRFPGFVEGDGWFSHFFSIILGCCWFVDVSNPSFVHISLDLIVHPFGNLWSMKSMMKFDVHSFKTKHQPNGALWGLQIGVSLYLQYEFVNVYMLVMVYARGKPERIFMIHKHTRQEREREREKWCYALHVPFGVRWCGFWVFMYVYDTDWWLQQMCVLGQCISDFQTITMEWYDKLRSKHGMG